MEGREIRITFRRHRNKCKLFLLHKITTCFVTSDISHMMISTERPKLGPLRNKTSCGIARSNNRAVGCVHWGRAGKGGQRGERIGRPPIEMSGWMVRRLESAWPTEARNWPTSRGTISDVTRHRTSIHVYTTQFSKKEEKTPRFIIAFYNNYLH